MATRLGMEAKIYYKVGGVAAGGTWNELGNARDVALNLEAGEADVTTRANQGWRAVVATLKEASIEFEAIWDSADPGFAALRDAFLGNNPIGIRCMDAAGGEGLQADFMVTGLARDEGLEEAIKANVTLKITRSDTPPEWIGG